jgi:cytochrome b involved in lipid metabolism
MKEADKMKENETDKKTKEAEKTKQDEMTKAAEKMKEDDTEKMNKDEESKRWFTYEQVVEEIEVAGRLMVIFDGRVYDCTQWALVHPAGGELPIRHVLGKDATDQVVSHCICAKENVI